jgi:hypothetical protein
MVYRCAEDQGMAVVIEGVRFGTVFEQFGSSYLYNDAGNQLSNKTVVANPSTLCRLYEPPARGWASRDHRIVFFQWHKRIGKAVLLEAEASVRPARFVSPLFFFDGHVSEADFTRYFVNGDQAITNQVSCVAE